jgi:hypothetical protein
MILGEFGIAHKIGGDNNHHRPAVLVKLEQFIEH